MEMLKSSQKCWMCAISVCLLVCYVMIAARLVAVQAHLCDSANKVPLVDEPSYEVTSYYSPKRGAILDRNGQVLAFSEDVRTIILNPGLVSSVDPETANAYLDKVSQLLNIDRAELNEKCQYRRKVTGGKWYLEQDENGNVVRTPHGLPVYRQVLETTETNQTPTQTVLGVIACDEDGKSLVNELGQTIFYRVTPRYNYGYLTNQYVRLTNNVPMQVWDEAERELRNFPLDTNKITKSNKWNYLSLRNAGVFAENGFKRKYPNGAFMSHLLGYTKTLDRSVDDGMGSIMQIEGVAGVEKVLNTDADGKPWLNGAPGWYTRYTRPSGRTLESWPSVKHPAVDGATAKLTLDGNIQQIVEDELEIVQNEWNARFVSGVVLEAKTGNILAYAMYPDFDPNDVGNYDAEIVKDKISLDLYEPGSTFKVVGFSAVLNEHFMRMNDIVDCRPAAWPREYGKIAGESHGYFSQPLTLEEVLMKSSNVGMGKICFNRTDMMRKYMTAFGYRQPTGIFLPGESYDSSDPIDDKVKTTRSRVPFGQAVVVTQLQSVMAYGAIANKGVLLRPQILDSVVSTDGQVLYKSQPYEVRRVLSEDVAKQVAHAMCHVVEGNAKNKGTGSNAQMKDHLACGKTGTAQQAPYISNKYMASFIGFFPESDPTIVIGIFALEPQGKHVGGIVCAPSFKVIGEKVARYLAIPADKFPVEKSRPQIGVRAKR